MEKSVLLLSIIRIDFNYSTLWIVHEIHDNTEIVNHSFIHECEYESYVNPLLEICETYVFRTFDIRNSSIHELDGKKYCGFGFNYEKPKTAELIGDYR